MLLQQLKPLTSLRFFAALWVILYSYIHELDGAVTIGLLDSGYLGVDLFFILSGFILSYVYLESLGQGRFDYGQFVSHRLARIYPLHLATLGLTLCLVAVAAFKGVRLDANVANWAALPSHVLLMQAWGLAPTASFNHPSWSISAEWFAYLAFPVVGGLAWRLRQRPMLAVLMAIGVILGLYAAFSAVAGFSLTHATFQWGALRIVPSFLYGSALYLAWRAGAVSKPGVALLGAFIASLTIILSTSFSQSDAVIVIAMGLLVLSVAGLGQTGEGIMSSRILVYLGEISFATYMIYVPWKWIYLKAINALLGSEHEALPMIWWVVGLVALIPLSMLSHHLIERPFRRIFRNWGDTLRYKLAYVSAKQG